MKAHIGQKQMYTKHEIRLLHSEKYNTLVHNDDDDDDTLNGKWDVARWQWLLCMYINTK
jgi:hypothetical protein